MQQKWAVNKWMNDWIKLHKSHSNRFFFLCLLRESDRMRLLISYWIICFRTEPKHMLTNDLQKYKKKGKQVGIVLNRMGSSRQGASPCNLKVSQQQCSHIGPKKCNPFKKLKGNADHMACSWVKQRPDAMLSNTKQMDVKTRHSKFNLVFFSSLVSFECLRNGNLCVEVTTHIAQHCPPLRHQKQTW